MIRNFTFSSVIKILTVLFLLCCGIQEIVIAQTIISKPVPFFFDLTSNEIWNFSQDRDGFIWAATSDGIARYDGHRLKSFRNDVHTPHLLTSNNATCICDGGNYLWIGTRSGITFMDKQTGRTLLPKDNNPLRDINTEYILCTDTSIWVSDANNIIYRCDEFGDILKSYDFRQSIPQSSHKTIKINSLYTDRNSTLWVMLGQAGIAYYNPSKDKFEQLAVTVELDFYIMYQTIDRRYWIGTWGQGLYELNTRTGVLTHHPITNSETGIEEQTFFSMEQDDTFGYLWLLSFNSLYTCSIDNNMMSTIDLSSSVEPHKMYTRILKDREGNLWLSSYDDAYVVNFDCSPIHNYIFKIHGWDANLLNLGVDETGIIWMEQDRSGLCCYNPWNKELIINAKPNELTEEALSKRNQCVVYDSDSIDFQLRAIGLDYFLDDCVPLMSLKDKEALWVITNKRIIRYNLQNKKFLIYSTKDENIKINQFRQHAATLDGQGGLYAGGHNGFIHIGRETNTDRIRWTHNPIVTDITTGDTASIITHRTNRGQLYLYPDAKNIEIHLSSLKFGIGQQPRIAYKIDGIDKKWNVLPPDCYSIYLNKIDKGTYRLWLKHEYEPGQWSEGNMVLTIHRQAAWYETWWAYVLYFIAILCLIFLLLITPFRISQLRRHIKDLMNNARLQQSIMERLPEAIPMEDADELFLQSLIKEAEIHLGETDYDLSIMSQSLGVSKSTLNRRVKQLTNMTPSDFLFHLRMKRAEQLLKESSLTVSEIAYTVGFSNPKYFARCFKKTFSCTPSIYKQQYNNDYS